MAEEVEVEEDAETILADILDLLTEEKKKRENPYIITIPPEGGTETLTEGTTQLDFYTGEVILADGTEGKLSGSLESIGETHARSVVINADKQIVVELDDGGKHTVDVNTIFSPTNQRFRIAFITVTEDTEISVWASTNPDGILEVPKTRGVPIYKDSKFNSAVTADTDIFTSALSPTYSPTIFRIYACFSAAGVLSVRRTKSGTTVTEKLNNTADLIADAAYNFDIVVKSGETINLRYDAAATAYSLSIMEIGGGIMNLPQGGGSNVRVSEPITGFEQEIVVANGTSSKEEDVTYNMLITDIYLRVPAIVTGVSNEAQLDFFDEDDNVIYSTGMLAATSATKYPIHLQRAIMGTTSIKITTDGNVNADETFNITVRGM